MRHVRLPSAGAGVALMLVVVAACGTAPDGGSTTVEPSRDVDGQTSQQQPNSGTSTDEDSSVDGGGGVGSPLRVPLPIAQISGLPLSDGLPRLQENVVAACGGTLCREIVTVGQRTELAEGETCDIVDSVDGQLEEDGQLFVDVEPGEPIRVVVNVRCEDDSTPPEAGGGIGSPLRIPLPLDELRGRDFASGLADLQLGIASACGGEQCVTVQKTGERTELTEGEACDTVSFVEGAQSDPDTFEPFVQVEEGGTVTVVVNVRCEDDDTPPGGETPDGSTQSDGSP